LGLVVVFRILMISCQTSWAAFSSRKPMAFSTLLKKFLMGSTAGAAE
jgi:hypothetical protein